MALCKLQRLLEHKLPIMTQHYAHHYPERLWDGVEILDRLAGGRTNLAPSARSPTELLQVSDEEFGGPCRGRTYGPLIKSQLLYQLS